MARTAEEIHEANNAVIAAAQEAAIRHGVNIAIAVAGTCQKGDQAQMVVGVDGCGRDILPLAACCAGAWLNATGSTAADLYTHWFAQGVKNAGSMLSRDVIEPASSVDEEAHGEGDVHAAIDAADGEP